MIDHYAVLKVSRDAPPEVIRASYSALMRQAHPDVDGSDGVTAGQLNEARRILLDPGTRAAYDASLDAANEPAPSEPESPEPSWGTEGGWDEPAPGTSAPPPMNDFTPPPAPPPYPMGHHPPQGFGFGGGYQSEYHAVPGAVGSTNQLWRGVTKIERFTGIAWLALSLVGPAGVVVGTVIDPRTSGTLVGNLLTYAVLFALSVHVAKRRILKPGMSKRYVPFVGVALVLTFGSLQWPLTAAYFGAWTALFVAATETRRRRAWETSP